VVKLSLSGHLARWRSSGLARRSKLDIPSLDQRRRSHYSGKSRATGFPAPANAEVAATGERTEQSEAGRDTSHPFVELGACLRVKECRMTPTRSALDMVMSVALRVRQDRLHVDPEANP
jgi:hypothetical protein